MNTTSLHSSRTDRFESVMSTVTDDLNHFASWLNRDPESAKDVVQETMLSAWRCFDSLRDEAAVKPWLFTIARNETNRQYARKKLLTVDIDEQSESRPQLSTTDDYDGVDAVYEALDLLDADYREPLLLKTLKGHSSREIGSMMGLTIGAVNTRIFRARDQLRVILDEVNTTETTTLLQ